MNYSTGRAEVGRGGGDHLRAPREARRFGKEQGKSAQNEYQAHTNLIEIYETFL